MRLGTSLTSEEERRYQAHVNIQVIHNLLKKSLLAHNDEIEARRTTSKPETPQDRPPTKLLPKRGQATTQDPPSTQPRV